MKYFVDRFRFAIFLFVAVALFYMGFSFFTDDGTRTPEEFEGEIIQVWAGEEGRTSAMTVRNEQGREMGFRLTEETRCDYPEDHQPGNRVMVSYSGKAESLTSPEGETLGTYLAKSIYLYEWLERDAVTLKDGQTLDILWSRKERTPDCLHTYKLPDGPRLLDLWSQEVPEVRYIAGIENPDFTLSEAAREKVVAYYEAQGALYDLEEELERAWSAYQEEERYVQREVNQSIFATVSSQRILYFTTTLSVPDEDRAISAIFDRETGEEVPVWDVFACAKEEVAEAILTRNKIKEPLAGKIKGNLKPENLVFYGNGLMLLFEEGDLPGEELPVKLSIDYEEAGHLFQGWAAPIQRK